MLENLLATLPELLKTTLYIMRCLTVLPWLFFMIAFCFGYAKGEALEQEPRPIAKYVFGVGRRAPRA